MKDNSFLSYDGLNLFPIIGDYLRYLFKTRFLWCAYYIESYESLFRKNKIKAVILMSDLAPLDSSLVLVAKRHGILSVIVPHGALIEKRSFYPIMADKSMVWGKIMKKQMEGFGISPNRLVITGPCVFDNFIKKKIYAEHLLKKFGIDKKDFVILLCTQKFEDVYYEKEVEETIKMAVKAIEGMLNTKMIVTIHPREFPYVHEAVLKELGMQNKIPVVKGDINELLSISDVMIGSFSTTTFNAILYEKPMIYLNPINRHKIFPVVESRTAVSAANKEELAKKLEEVMTKKYLKQSKKYGKKFFKDYCYKTDGKASKRIIDFVMKSINDEE
jgi:CDP-glycerol glycerophosphotransferase (TagB/SpsB family)